MHVERVGHGPPLVLLHGWAMHGGVFAPLVERMRAQHTLHVVDLPGHGSSRDAATPLALDATMRAIADAVPPAPWIGWSLGGLLALHAAHAVPARVPALVMLCANPCFVRKADWPYGVSPEIFADFARGLGEDYRGTLDRFVALEAFGDDRAKDALRALRAELFARGEPAARALIDGLALLDSTDLRHVLPALRVPSLWLAGRRDRLVPPRALRASAAIAPQAAFAEIEHGGHAPFLTHADAVVARLLEFFARHSRESENPVTFALPTAKTQGSRLRTNDENNA